jgi:hypothetical protein
MSFRMDVRIDEVLEDGSYGAVLENVEEKETKFGERLMWTFLTHKGVEVVGFTSMSPSTKANAYIWAKAIIGEVDPKLGWGPEDVIGGECTVVVEVTEDAQGVEKNKVVRVRPPRNGDGSGGSIGSPEDAH